jgi:flavin-binding protein dodecin
MSLAGRVEMIKDDHVYKTVELTGTSRSTFEAAVQSAIRTASRTLRHLRWFEVIDVRGEINNGSEIHWQVTLKVGFTLESSDDQTDDRTLQIFGKGRVRLPGGPSQTKREKLRHKRL